jgi:trigger factor
VPLTLGSGGMIPGFEAGLVGAAKDESRTLTIEFPADYQATELAGKPAQFEVTVHRVAEPHLPELDPDFIRSFGVADGTEESLRKDVRGNMERELEQKLEGIVKERAMAVLMERNPVEVPGVLVADEARRLRDQARQDMARAGHSSSLELPISLFEEQARKRVALGLVVGEVLRAHDVRLDQDRLRRKIARFAESYEDPEEVVKWYYGNREALRPVENLVLEDQVVDWVLGRVNVEDEQSSFSALMGQ